MLVPFATSLRTARRTALTHNIMTIRQFSTTNKNHPTTPKWRFEQQPPILNRKCRVVFAGPHFQAGLSYIREMIRTSDTITTTTTTPHPHLELLSAPTTSQLLEYAPTMDVAIPFMEAFDDQFLTQATNLRLIMQYGVGLERVDVRTATTLGIAVSNIPADGGSGNAPATAEHALWLAMSLLRYHHVNPTPTTTNHNNNHNGDDDDDSPSLNLQERFQQRILGGLPVPRTLYQKRVTVVGYGAVGSLLVEYLVQLGARVTVIRKQPWEKEFVHAGHHKCKFQTCHTLEDALPHTDVLFLACTMTLETFHLLNAKTLGLLPLGALVVNVGRGPLVEYASMVEALTSQHIGGYASDVGIGHDSKVSEPWDPSDPLSQLPNVIFTPHVGGYCDYSYSTMGQSVMEAICAVQQGKPPPVWVNQEVEPEQGT